MRFETIVKLIIDSYTSLFYHSLDEFFAIGSENYLLSKLSPEDNIDDSSELRSVK